MSNNLKKPFYGKKKDSIREKNSQTENEDKKGEDNAVFSNKEVLSVVGGNIRVLRKEYKMSISDLANKANMSSKYLQGVEVGKRNISVTNLDKIASVLKVDIADLFLRVSEKSDKIFEISSYLKNYNSKQLDTILEVIVGFDNRVSSVEELTDIKPNEDSGNNAQL